MTSHSLFFSLSHLGILEFSGEDRFSFLQGLISADIESVTDTRAVWAALLTPQGKVLHDFFITKYGDTLLLEAERVHMDALRTRLLRYKLRAHVRIEICTERVVFGHLAPLPDPCDPLTQAGDVCRLPGISGLAFLDPRLAEGGARFIASPSDISSYGETTEDLTAWECQRIRCGLPDGSRDIIPEKGFLLEYGFEELNGVDFNKGCYVGQETTARMKWKRLVKKRLVPISLPGAATDIPSLAPVEHLERSAGYVCSWTRDEAGMQTLALAVLNVRDLDQKDLTCQGHPVTVHRPSWLDLSTSQS